MNKDSLPKDLRGDWIWTNQLLRKVDCHLFARREFSLDSAVPFAELWISAVSSYHLFVNGIHVGYGPSPSTREIRYADRYEISCHLQAGLNSIAIHAHHVALPTFSRHLQQPGLWCQLDIGGTPHIWTDNRWHVLGGACYETGQPRRHSCSEFIEKLNFESYPMGWLEPGFNDRGWERPDWTVPLKSLKPSVVSSPCAPCSLYECDPLAPIAIGSFEEFGECTHVSFANIFGGEGGVYAAQTFFHSEEEQDIPFSVASDDPFALFCNDRLCVSRGVSMAHSGKSFMSAGSSLYLQSVKLGESPLASGRIQIRKGWNRVLVVQENGTNSMGFLIDFQTLKKGSFRFLRERSHESTSGWKLAGPLRMPLSAATGSLRLERLPSAPYTAVKENVNDVSSWLGSCKFDMKAVVKEGETPADGESPKDFVSKGLKTGDCVVYDLGEIQYGFVCLDLVGGGGDIVDVTSSVRSSGERVPTFGLFGRNTDTLTLRAGSNNWIKSEPKGVRHIMLTVRKSSSLVFPQVRFANILKDRDDEAEFSCSDSVFNKIWETGKSTLLQTVNSVFMDSPCGKRSQALPEAFIESMACFYSFGESSMSEKAIREFALAQTENGNIPEFSSNGIYNHVPDYALLWPMWLDAHWQATGDAEFRDEMLPHLDLLLDFFGTLAKEDGGLLVDLDSKYRMKPVIDHAPIDRRGMCTGLNALYCRALLSASNLYSSAGKLDLSNSCRSSASAVAAAVRSLAFDSNTGLFADCFSDGVCSESRSLQTNILALLSGIASLDSYDVIMDSFFGPGSSPLGRISTPRFKYFLLETMFAFGRNEDALACLKSYWGAMLEAGDGLWWSAFDPEAGHGGRDPEAIQCYGGAVSPNIFIVKELVGIRPAVPGFSRIYFNPAFKTVSSAKVKLPTPYGKISLEWKLADDGSMEVSADANFPLDIAPVLPPEIFEKCTFQLGKSVNVLDPESSDVEEE